ncbi:hypothetical protein [Fibrobacter sp. UBA4297]|uniref:hypothetical protein n=1 Tax=Fibrobacter sp. UBA4297 TaxID=1946536 RepID=UPI0025C62E8E|nr:hypothetical protein [Fibrobacter sp. UBA4297]
MKGEFFRLIGVAMTALVCVGMWGCMGCSDEKVIDSGTSIGNHFYVVDDSTIMLDFFNWETVEFYSSYIHGQDEETRVTEYLAYLVNVNRDTVYKKIDFPENKKSESLDQVEDGLIFFFNKDDYATGDLSKASEWRFAQSGNVVKLNVVSGDIDSTDYLVDFRNENFKGKKILSLHDMKLGFEYRSRFFYVWNIVPNSIARWEPTGESAWMAECNDIRWTEKQFRCLMAKGDIFLFDENKNVLDSLAKGSYQLDVSANYSLRFYGNYIGVGHHIYKMYDDGKIGDKPLFEIDFELPARDRTVLYPSSGDTVYYSEENIK